MAKVEKDHLEAQFELQEIEIKKQIRSEDAKLNEILDELKRRHPQGYLGQLYELLKPVNQKYDLAIKVGMRKCLRYLVVDSVANSKYVTEFLKDKEIQKDILVLANLPEPREKQV
mmetsp:Transcript_36469/g.55985  ORF Transcript_36469/g.55985 Transcript_36469/m.55985 type:complete len:115 (+) Transcript_36469:348-692(+)